MAGADDFDGLTFTGPDMLPASVFGKGRSAESIRVTGELGASIQTGLSRTRAALESAKKAGDLTDAGYTRRAAPMLVTVRGEIVEAARKVWAPAAAQRGELERSGPFTAASRWRSLNRSDMSDSARVVVQGAILQKLQAMPTAIERKAAYMEAIEAGDGIALEVMETLPAYAGGLDAETLQAGRVRFAELRDPGAHAEWANHNAVVEYAKEIEKSAHGILGTMLREVLPTLPNNVDPFEALQASPELLLGESGKQATEAQRVKAFEQGIEQKFAAAHPA